MIEDTEKSFFNDNLASTLIQLPERDDVARKVGDEVDIWEHVVVSSKAYN